MKASEALRASLVRVDSGLEAGAVVEHFEDSLREIQRVRNRVAAKEQEGEEKEEAGSIGGRGGLLFGGKGPSNVLKLAVAALSADR